MEHTTPIWRIAREEPILFGICLCSSHEICMLCAALLRSFVLQPCNLHAMCNTSASAGRNPRRFLLCGSENFFYLAVNTAAGLPIDEFSNVAMRNTGCPKDEHHVSPDEKYVPPYPPPYRVLVVLLCGSENFSYVAVNTAAGAPDRQILLCGNEKYGLSQT